MTSLFFTTAAKLLLPSGTRAEFLRWRARAIDLDAASSDREFERVAVVRIAGQGQVEFSESYMRQVKVLSESP